MTSSDGEALIKSDELRSIVSFFEALQQLLLAASRVQQTGFAAVRAVASRRLSSGSVGSVEINLSDSPSGALIADAYRGRRKLIKRSTLVSLLELPIDPSKYLVGRKRQVVRTARTRAAKLGFDVVRASPGEHPLLYDELKHAGLGDPGLQTLCARSLSSEGMCWLLLDAERRAIGGANVFIDGSVARLDVCVVANIQEKSTGRYLLCSEIFLALAESGVRILVVDSALLLSNGLREFQERLGFSVHNLRIHTSRHRTMPHARQDPWLEPSSQQLSGSHGR